MDRKKKRELRDQNARVWAGEAGVFATASSLDSSLKKNTAFIKRLRTSIAGNTTTTCLQEIRTLSLHKYLSEVISASYEGLCRLKTPADILAGVEVVSALHQRFGPAEFTSFLGWNLGRGLSTPDKSQLKALSADAREKEEKERISRQRNLLKVVTELWLVGVLRSLDDVSRPEDNTAKAKEGSGLPGGKGTEKGSKGKADAGAKGTLAEPFPLEVLKDLLNNDRDHVNLPLVVNFVKAFSWDILGVETAVEKSRQTATAEGTTTTSGEAEEQFSADESGEPEDTVHDPPFTDAGLQQRFKNILQRYLDDVKAHIVKDQKAIYNQGKKNAEAYVKSGEVFEDRQANFEKQCKAQEKLVASAQVLCDVLDSEMPNLKDTDTVEAAAPGAIGLVKTGEYLRGQGEGPGIWEDEEERRFYENLIDVKDRVPGILLEDAKKKKPEIEPQVGKRNDSVAPEMKEEDEKSKPPEANDDQSTAIANKTVGAQVEALLARLPELQTKDAVDQLAVDFCFLNSKASRNRLLKSVQEVPKGRSDLLPIYSRLVTTLGKYLTDISSGLVSYLDDEFRSLQRRKAKDFLGQARTGNIRYLAELTKFGLVPEHVIFHCLKVSLDDFSRMNIEIIANLLENCGRYLLRNPDTAPRMKTFMETLQRKKTAHHLGQQERMLVENAMYYVDPPQRAAIQQKERTPTELYLRKLIYVDMNRRTYAKTLKSVRKLHWEEPEVVEILEKIFTKPGKIKYGNIHFLAILVNALYRYHQDFVVSVLDTMLEYITLGLEQNDFKFNQKRIAEVKYLGELYNYKMLDSPVIFDTMYRIVTFGHVNGTPTPERLNSLDLPDDFFRVRLICTILDTCGTCFERGPAKKKLDFFLTFFQYYISTKDSLPMDIDFTIQDTYGSLRPQWNMTTDLSEAGRLFAEAVSQNYRSGEADRTTEQEEAEEELASPDEDGGELPAYEGESTGEEAEAEPTTNGEPKYDSDFEPEIIVTRQEEERDPEAEAEFDRELARMMTESMDSRKFERKQHFDVPLPIRKGLKDQASADDVQQDSVPASANMMAFSLMTKRGNKQQTRTIELPSDSHFAVAMKTQQEAERAEQQRIKNLVLNLNESQDNGDSDGTDDDFFLQPNPNLNSKLCQRSNAHSKSEGIIGEKHQFNAPIQQTVHHPNARSSERPSGGRGGHRAKKLQLNDIDWYDKCASTHPSNSAPASRGGEGRSHRRGNSQRFHG